MAEAYYSFKCISYNTLDFIIEKLEERSAKYYIICHDSDIDDNGETKKEHLHIVFTVPIRMRYNQVYNLFNTNQEQNTLIKVAEDLTHDIRYLTHKDDKNKHQYLDEEVVTNNPERYKKYISGKESGGDEEKNEAFCNDLLTLNVKQMAIKYGRDYMKNYKSYEYFKIALQRCDNMENQKWRELENEEELKK